MQKIKSYLQSLYGEKAEMWWYYLTWLVYGLVIILSTLYCYMRLDYIRTTPKTTAEAIN